MSFKTLLSVINGEVIDSQDTKAGTSVPVAIASTEVFDTEIDSFTGTLTISIGDDSAVVPCYKTAGVQVVGTVAGGAEFSGTKDTASKLNIYVEDGNIVLQNLTGADVEVSARLF